MRVLLTLAVLAMPAATGAQPQPARDPVVELSAGFDGYYTVGRWLPIRVAAESGERDFSGELVVQWGPATYRQALTLPAPSKKRFEFHVRAADLRDSIQVVLRDREGALRTTYDVAVRGVLPAERLHLILDPLPARAAGAHAVSVRPEELPSSWRGYDGVDEVEISASRSRLTAAQDIALARWDAVRAIDAVDALRRQARQQTGAGAVDAARWQYLAMYVAGLAAVLVGLPIVTRRALFVHAALAVVALAGIALAPTVGTRASRMSPRTDPEQAVATRHGVYVTTVTLAAPRWRGTARVVSDLSESLLEAPAAAPPHDVVYSEDGSVSLELMGSLGETFSIAGRGFSREGAARD